MSQQITFVFKCEDGFHKSYQLSYEPYQPCPVWRDDEYIVVDLSDLGPHYAPGSFKQLIDYHEKNGKIKFHEDKLCSIIYNNNFFNSGYEDSTFIETLTKDIKNAGFDYSFFMNMK